MVKAEFIKGKYEPFSMALGKLHFENILPTGEETE